MYLAVMETFRCMQMELLPLKLCPFTHLLAEENDFFTKTVIIPFTKKQLYFFSTTNLQKHCLGTQRKPK